MMALRTPALQAVLAWTVTACAPLIPALPDTAQPPQPRQWQAQTGSTETAAIDARWWQALGDPRLSAWVEQALAHNNDVLAARARIDEARAQVLLAGAAGRPVLDAVLPMSSGRSLGSTGMAQLRSLQPGVQASWESDLWGRLDALGRAADLRYQASQADRDAIGLSVAATTAQAYVGLLSLQAQLRSAQATRVSREHALQLAADQARVGYISQLQLTQAQSEYHSVLQSMELLRRQQGQFGVSVAQRDQAAYAYRGVVIQALADVENALAGNQRLQTQMAQAQERQQVLQRSLGFAHDRYQAGYASYLEELDAQRHLFAVQQEVIRLRQSQLENVIALCQALGGGWQAGGVNGP